MAAIALKLTPLDVLFFRDARPFDQADSADSGLSTPQSFYGLVKTHLARTSGLSFSNIHGLRKSNDPNRWISEIRTRGAWLYVDHPEKLKASLLNKTHDPDRLNAICQGVIVPVPADIVQLGKTGDSLTRLRPLDESVIVPGWNETPRRPLWWDDDETPRAASGFLGQVALQKYLRGEDLCANEIIPIDWLYKFEPRTGIGVDSAKMIATDGQIYAASFLRLQPGVSFYGEIEIDDEHESKLRKEFAELITLPWGGEGRRVCVKKCDAMNWPKSPVVNGDGRLLSLLVTPGIFGSRDGLGQNGQGVNPQQAWMPRELGTLRAAAVPRPKAISGWNLSGRTDIDAESPAAETNSNDERDHPGCPRPTRYAAPAGSVYFWQRGKNNRSDKNGTELKPLESLGGRPLESDSGWGLSLTGTWRWFGETSD